MRPGCKADWFIQSSEDIELTTSFSEGEVGSDGCVKYSLLEAEGGSEKEGFGTYRYLPVSTGWKTSSPIPKPGPGRLLMIRSTNSSTGSEGSEASEALCCCVPDPPNSTLVIEKEVSWNWCHCAGPIRVILVTFFDRESSNSRN